jgi:hypothetical protein
MPISSLSLTILLYATHSPSVFTGSAAGAINATG